MRRTPPLALALALLALVAGPDPARGEGELVVVDRFRLNPSTVSIPAGASVTFRMEQDESLVEPMQPLTLVADDGSFRSPPLEPGERWRFRFERAGLYRYHIEQHPDVEGAIVVE